MKSLSFRIPDRLFHELAERIRPWHTITASAGYRRILEEWIRLQEHPMIRFVDGPAGRRAALVGGPDVCQLIEVMRDFDFDHERILDAYPWLSAEKLEAVMSYFKAHPDEIEVLIEDNRRLARDLSGDGLDPMRRASQD